MSGYLGEKSGKALKLGCVTAPGVGEFPTGSVAASGTTNGDAIFAKLGAIQVNADVEWAGGHLLRNGDFGAFTLGTTAMPDGWTATTGTYGSASDIYFTSATVKTGKYSLILQGATASIADSDWMPVERSADYVSQVTWQADSMTAGNTVTVSVRWYDESRVFISASTITSKVALGVNSWDTDESDQTAPATAQWARIRITKAANNFLVRIDRAHVQRRQSFATFADEAQTWRVLYAATLGSAATTIGGTLPSASAAQCSMIKVLATSSGLAGAGGIPGFQFNADSGNNYWYRVLSVAAGGAVLVNTQAASAPYVLMMRAAITTPFVLEALIHNYSASRKSVMFSSQDAVGSAATPAELMWGGGLWDNTGGLLSSISLLNSSGVNFNSGTKIVILGKEP